MSPADEKGKDEVETEVVDETTLEPVPVEPDADTEVEVEETPAAEVEASAEPKPKRTRAKKADAPVEEAPKPAAAKPAPTGGRPVVRAHAKYVRTSARKARLVCDHIRGKSVTEARAILAYTPRAVAEDWQKLLESAVANAEHNHELLGDDLRILSVTADEGPTLKRFRPRAMGRASAIRKRTSHLSIALTPKEQ
jgi:ribosomal protein L22